MGALILSRNVYGNTARSGFTLVEILVVLLLLGIMASVVAVRAEQDQRRILQREATRFAASLEQAIAMAQYQAVTLGVSAQGSTYRFWRRDGDGQWHVITATEPLAPHMLPDGFDARPQHYAGASVARDAILPLRASGRNEPFDLVLATRDWLARIRADPLNRVRIDIAPNAS